MKFKKIYIEITNICNKDCLFCSKTNRKKREMLLNEFEYVLKEVKKYTDYIYLHVKGEPLMHSKFNEILSLCELYKVKVNITTNGSLIKNKKDVLSSYQCIRQLNISTHSMENISEIEDVLYSIDEIRRKNNFYVVYRYWTIPKNLDTYSNDILKKISSYYNLSQKKIKDIEENKNIKIDEYTYVNKANEFDWPLLTNSVHNEYGFCYGLKNHIAILSDGTVVPCCLDAEGKIPLGNIFEKSLFEILNNNFTLSIKKNFENNIRICDLCKHCSFITKNK